MPSYTTRNRVTKQDTGSNPSAWGLVLNGQVFDLLDTALDGWTSIDPTGGVTLTSVNGAADQARARVLKLITATGSNTVTIPALEKFYLVWNATTAAQTIASAGGGTTVSIAVGEVVFAICDGTNVKRLTLLTMGGAKLQNVADPTSPQDAATKAYVDATAFNMAAGSLPGQVGNGGRFLRTNGANAAWSNYVRTARLFLDGKIA